MNDEDLSCDNIKIGLTQRSSTVKNTHTHDNITSYINHIKQNHGQSYSYPRYPSISTTNMNSFPNFISCVKDKSVHAQVQDKIQIGEEII